MVVVDLATLLKSLHPLTFLLVESVVLGTTLCDNCGIPYVGHYIQSGAPASSAPYTTITQVQTLQSDLPVQSTPLAASVPSAAVQWKATPILLLPPNPPPLANPSPLPSSSLTSLYPLLQQSQAAVRWQVSQPAMGSTNDRHVAKALLHQTQESGPFGTARGSSHPRDS